MHQQNLREERRLGRGAKRALEGGESLRFVMSVAEGDLAGDRPPAGVQGALEEVGQGHVTEHWPGLSADERKGLLEQIAGIDLGALRRQVEESTRARGGGGGGDVGPVHTPAPVSEDQVLSRANLDAASRKYLVSKGLRLIAEGKVGVVVLAGGQGTRLGTKLPKGCVDIRLPFKKTLFQIQSERILSLQKIAAEATHGEGARVRNRIRWYIMLSDATRAYTETYFEKNAFFGLDRDQIFFFNQGKLPCLSEAGKVLMASRAQIAMSPDGNGGIYKALADSGCLDDMASAGIESLDCYCVDNLLAKIADPLLVGYCHAFGADVGCRTLAKSGPNERVGVFVKKGRGVGVVEYSELDPKMSAKVANESTGALYYNWSNICMQYYSRAFLSRVCAGGGGADLEYHVAVKRIPTIDGEVTGLKMEQFIFDVFPSAEACCLLEVRRECEFAPIKSEFETAGKALLALERRWEEDEAGVGFDEWFYLSSSL